VNGDETDDLIGFELLVFLLAGFNRWFKLMGKFVEELLTYPSTKLWMREASGEQPIWDLKTWKDDTEHMFLRGGWQDFATHYELHVGHVLKVWYCGEDRLSVKIFNYTPYLRSYYMPLFDEFGPESP
jgi:hypothetical protein